jgi:hypothetical protein
MSYYITANYLWKHYCKIVLPVSILLSQICTLMSIVAIQSGCNIRSWPVTNALIKTFICHSGRQVHNSGRYKRKERFGVALVSLIMNSSTWFRNYMLSIRLYTMSDFSGGKKLEWHSLQHRSDKIQSFL